jgi:hypothetical protein
MSSHKIILFLFFYDVLERKVLGYTVESFDDFSKVWDLHSEQTLVHMGKHFLVISKLQQSTIVHLNLHAKALVNCN